MNKEFYSKIIELYEKNIEEYTVTNQKGTIQLHRRFKNKEFANALQTMTLTSFEPIIKKYPNIKIKYKSGPPYNISTEPWIQIYYLEKNAKGTKGNYCGISINAKKRTIDIWIGFGMTKLKKEEVTTKKEELTSLYKSFLGEELERNFAYETVFVDAVIISKSYNIDTIKAMEIQKDLEYLIDCYIKAENLALQTAYTSFPKKEEKKEFYSKSKELIGKNIIYKGFPGSGKSYEIEHKYLIDKSGNYIDDACYERVTFYPEYTNAEFIGTIRPTIKNHQPTYDFFPGPFTKILRKAIQNPQTNFYLIIEELNRGNAESIFGDIFQLLDREKGNGRSTYSITNSCIAEYIYADEDKKIYIPENLSIIASMNVSDENVSNLDTAFERRWETIWVLGSTGIFDNKFIKGMDNITWGDFRNIINKKIVTQEGIIRNEDKQLGSYFINEELISDSPSKKDREKFLYKVILYLYNKVCKYDKSIIFSNKVESINSLITLFLSSNYLKVFNEEIETELRKEL